MRPALAPDWKNDGISVRIETPGGREPETTLHTYVPVPPVAVSAVSIWPMLNMPKLPLLETPTGGPPPAG
jgi:hypothetical protein